MSYGPYGIDPEEEAEAAREELEWYPAGKKYICCEDCGCIIREGEEYYETDIGCLCPDCFDIFKEERRRWLDG